MANHHFISYSSVDALDFALRLADALTSGPPTFSVWLDKRDLRAGEDWDAQLDAAIRTCAALLLVMTTDSVEDRSVCKQEWTHALKHQKPIVPIRLHRAVDLPFRLASRQFIDFSDDFAVGLAKLRTHLTWLATPAGQLQALKERLADAQRDLRRAPDAPTHDRLTAEVTQLQQQIAQQQPIVAAAQAAQPPDNPIHQPDADKNTTGAQITDAEIAGIADLRGANFSNAQGLTIAGVVIGDPSAPKPTPKLDG